MLDSKADVWKEQSKKNKGKKNKGLWGWQRELKSQEKAQSDRINLALMDILMMRESKRKNLQFSRKYYTGNEEVQSMRVKQT